MMFARYLGEDDGCLTRGKLYLADGGSTSDAADVEVVVLMDDCGRMVSVPTADGRFEFPPYAYAVALHAIGGMEAGEAAVVDDLDARGEYVKVKGVYLRADAFELLDRTNFRPGVHVRTRDGEWKPLTAVNERLEGCVGGGDMLSPTAYRFAVGDGGVMHEPLATCVESSMGLTVGRLYKVVREGDDGVHVVNDDGNETPYMRCRFSFDSLPARGNVGSRL